MTNKNCNICGNKLHISCTNLACNSCRKKNNIYHKNMKEARKLAGLCIQCGVNAPAAGKPGHPKTYVRCDECLKYQHEIRLNRKDKDVSYSKEYRLQKKLDVFNHYGNKCACCGIYDLNVLTVDHINEDGAKHRRNIGSGTYVLYKWVITNNYPNTIQLLCANCHLIKTKKLKCLHSKTTGGV